MVSYLLWPMFICVDRIVEYLEPPQFIKKVQDIDDKLAKTYTRIVNARNAHDRFRRCVSFRVWTDFPLVAMLRTCLENLDIGSRKLTHCSALHRLSADSEIELRQIFMQEFNKQLEQLQRAAGHASGEEPIDLFLKRRANLFNLGTRFYSISARDC